MVSRESDETWSRGEAREPEQTWSRGAFSGGQRGARSVSSRSGCVLETARLNVSGECVVARLAVCVCLSQMYVVIQV